MPAQTWPSNQRPKVITVVRNGSHPHSSIKVLLNRNSVQSFGQLMTDISGAFGPKWKNSKMRRLFTLDGREVLSTSDFFRGDDLFVGVGKEQLRLEEVRSLLEAVVPQHSNLDGLVHAWAKRLEPQKSNGKRPEDEKRDSGYDESEASHRGEEADTWKVSKKRVNERFNNLTAHPLSPAP